LAFLFHYCSRACQQRAYRHRAATRATDPPTIAALLAAIRELDATLTAGQAPTNAQLTAVAERTNALLNRASPHADHHVTAPVAAAQPPTATSCE